MEGIEPDLLRPARCMLTGVAYSPVWHARPPFWLQGTFGPRRLELTNLTEWLRTAPTERDALAGWVAQQMNLPPTLHRTFYRQRAHARVTPSTVARMACEPMTRCKQRAAQTRTPPDMHDPKPARCVGADAELERVRAKSGLRRPS